MNRAAKAALGCVLFPVGLFVIGLVVFAGARAVGVPESRSRSQSLEQALDAPPAPPTTEITSEPSGESSSVTQVEPGVIVFLELEEGMFTIEPGPAEQGIRVDADYDEATYRLEQSYDIEGETPVYRLRFESTVGWLRRLATQGGFDDGDMAENDILVTLPRDVPLKLVLKASKSETEVNLDGLALTDLAVDFDMGEYNVVSHRANPIPMGTFAGNFGMGEFDVEGISNFRCSRVEVEGSMGEARLDFRETLLQDTDVRVKWRMGEIGLRVPDDAYWDPDSRFSATMGEVDNARVGRTSDFDPETAHHLKVDASIFMGEMVVREVRGRGPAIR